MRAAHPGKSLAYDPDKMPSDLLVAHKALSKAVEDAYGVSFNGDEEKTPPIFLDFMQAQWPITTGHDSTIYLIGTMLECTSYAWVKILFIPVRKSSFLNFHDMANNICRREWGWRK